MHFIFEGWMAANAPVVRIVVESHVEAETLPVEGPAFHVGSIDWEARRRLEITGEIKMKTTLGQL